MDGWMRQQASVESSREAIPGIDWESVAPGDYVNDERMKHAAFLVE